MNAVALRAEFQPPSVPPGPDAARAAAHFGLCHPAAARIVWDGQTVTPGPGRILLFTGRSGSGKSTALGLIGRTAGEAGSGLHVVRESEVRLPAGGTLLDHFGDGTGAGYDAATALLASAGLADARLWISPIGVLSDGQRARARLAVMIRRMTQTPEGRVPIGLMDEFCAALDRTTAETVCRNVRRTADRNGWCFAVAATAEDVADWLRPDEWWHRPDEMTAVRRAPRPDRWRAGVADGASEETTELSTLGIAKEGGGDGESAEGFAVIETSARAAGEFIRPRHYRGGPVAGSVRCWGLFRGERMMGALTMGHPTAGLQAHLICGASFARDGRTAGSRIRGTMIINRVVVDDALRGRGLGTWLVRRCLELSGADTVMVVAEMARHHPVFRRAGMRPAGHVRSGRPVLVWNRPCEDGTAQPAGQSGAGRTQR